MKRLVLVFVAGCWGNSTPAPAPPTPPASVQWSVRVEAPEGVADFNFFRIDLTRHAAVRIATVPLGAVALAERANQIAVVFTKVTAECTTCESVAIYDLAGKPAAEFPLVTPGKRSAYARDRELGFDGRLLWMYRYHSFRRNHGFDRPESCGYEVYDVVARKRVRVLADARGEWAKLTKGCAVRALLPTADGGAIAFVVVDQREGRVVKFAAPP